MSDFLAELLLHVSNALLIPDVALLLFFCGFTLYHTGGVAAEAAHRAGVGKKKLTPAMVERVRAGEPCDKLLDDLELQAERRLATLNLGVRLGPLLGLAGTLIPLGPALVALASGDVKTLSTRLVMAFTTTVIGLLVGAACFVIHSIRRNWYRQDLSDVEFALRDVA